VLDQRLQCIGGENGHGSNGGSGGDDENKCFLEYLAPLKATFNVNSWVFFDDLHSPWAIDRRWHGTANQVRPSFMMF
jgi:hypothetical protein